MVDTRGINNAVPEYEQVQENRIGIDTRVDVVIGAWFEGSWINNNMDLGNFTNQEL